MSSVTWCGATSSALYDRLIDDAAMFPPKSADLDTALSGRLARLHSPADAYTGSFLVPAGRAADLLQALGAAPPTDPVRVGVIGSDDPAATADAAARLARSDLVRLELVELRLDPFADPVDAVERAVARASVGLAADAAAEAAGKAAAQTASEHRSAGRAGPAHRPAILCEVPHPWLEDGRLVHAVAAMAEGASAAWAGPVGAKLRTGGTRPQAFPTVAALARLIEVCVQHGVAFKCTAGLHRAVRSCDPASNLLHHGFANILLATHLALRGSAVGAIRSALHERRPAVVAAGLDRIGAEQTAAVRSTFLSYGSCDTATPVGDIGELLMAVP